MKTSTFVSLATSVLSALALVLLSYLDATVPGLTRDKLFIIITLSLCYLAWSRHRFVTQFNKISIRPVTFGIIGHLRELLSGQRGDSMSAVAHEMVKSVPLLTPNNQSGFMSLFLGPILVIYATTPETVQAVLTHKQTQAKGPHYKMLSRAIGDGLITSSRDRWHQHRKLLTPAFHFQILKSLVPIVRNKSQVFMSRLNEMEKKTPNLSARDHEELISDFTLDVLCQSSMGINMKDQSGIGIAHHFKKLYEAIAVITLSPWMWPECLLKLYPTGRRFASCAHKISSLADQVIRHRIQLWKSGALNDERREGEQESTGKSREVFIDIMIREHLRNANTFSIGDIVDETKTFLWAGHDTTGVTLGYTLLLIGHHPQVQARVHQEIDSFYCDHSDDDLTPERLKNFVYLEAVISETLRLFPVAPLILRVAEDDIQINGQFIPKGTEIIISMSLLHLNAKYWPNPHRFKPERFLDKQHHPFAFLPFSAGPRNCIGQKYAMVSMKSFLILLLKIYSVKSTTQLSDIRMSFTPVLAPFEPLEMQFIRRSQGGPSD